jgi:hypothetical protein
MRASGSEFVSLTPAPTDYIIFSSALVHDTTRNMIRAFGLTANGGFDNIAPSEYLFDDATGAASGTSVDFPNDLLLGATSYGGQEYLFFEEGAWGGKGMAGSARLGALTTLANLDPMTLPLVPNAKPTIPAYNGRFWDFPNDPPVMVWTGNVAGGTNMDFAVVGADGYPRVYQLGTGPTPVLPAGIKSIVATASVALAPPKDFPTFPIAWVTASTDDAGYPIQTVWYGKLACGPSP